jgi:hypothetical protein
MTRGNCETHAKRDYCVRSANLATRPATGVREVAWHSRRSRSFATPQPPEPLRLGPRQQRLRPAQRRAGPRSCGGSRAVMLLVLWGSGWGARNSGRSVIRIQLDGCGRDLQ